MATERAHRRFSVDDYHHMLEAGILSEDDRVELLDGEVVEMSPIGGRHMYAPAGIADGWLVDIPGEAIERHADPIGDAYRVSLRAGRGGMIESAALPDFSLAAGDVLSR